MKKFICYFTGFLLLCLSFIGMFYFMLSSRLPVNTGGIVYNFTSSSLTISSDSYIGIIPANKSSIEQGIPDVDAIIIDRPMFFHGKVLKDKVLKFCNYNVIEVQEQPNGKIEIRDRNFGWVWRLAGKIKTYDSVKEAFGQT